MMPYGQFWAAARPKPFVSATGRLACVGCEVSWLREDSEMCWCCGLPGTSNVSAVSRCVIPH